MKVEELVGKDIMKAYDGNYLHVDFGYSCANFNVRNSFGGNRGWGTFESHGGSENDEATFDFYTKNPKNVSCFVCYADNGKIWGRRMFFKGPSMINHDEFEVPIDMGEEVRYLYGYYGSNDPIPQKAIGNAVIKKYGDAIIYTDRGALKRGQIDKDIPNFWIMEVENVNFSKYPPVDHLSVSIELKSLSNFEPKKYIKEILERDFNKKNIEFNSAYRFNPNKKKVKYDYTTWDKHKGIITSADDYTKIIADAQDEEIDEEEIDLDDIKVGDVVKSTETGYINTIIEINDDSVILKSQNLKYEFPLSKKRLKDNFVRI